MTVVFKNDIESRLLREFGFKDSLEDITFVTYRKYLFDDNKPTKELIIKL